MLTDEPAERLDDIDPSPADSQAQLALSIARAVQRDLPAGDSEAEIAAAVEAALQSEARRNEEWLASVRVGLVTAVAIVAIAAAFAPNTVGRTDYPWWPALVAMGALAATVAFVLALRRLYRPELRRVFPLFDAALVGAAGVLFPLSIREDATAIPTSFFALLAASCAYLAFSGAVRLSRRAAQLSTLCAIVIWIGVAAWGGLRIVPASMIGGLVLAAGVLSARIPRIAKRVITPEIARLRLSRMYEDAKAAIAAREEVLRIVSHDLRNPLSTISMATDLVLEEQLSEADRRRYLGAIKRSGERMRRMIHDLLDVARIEAGKLPIELSRTEVGEILKGARELMEPIANEHGLTLVEEVEADLPPVLVDPERINQVFSNLIGNAIKFTPSNGHVVLSARSEAGKIRFAVIDTGPGIAPDDLARIFRSMWQADRADTRGIGLGLTIARSIVEAHGEKLQVNSRVGVGTEFFFSLPADQDSPAPVVI